MVKTSEISETGRDFRDQWRLAKTVGDRTIGVVTDIVVETAEIRPLNTGSD